MKEILPVPCILQKSAHKIFILNFYNRIFKIICEMHMKAKGCPKFSEELLYNENDTVETLLFKMFL